MPLVLMDAAAIKAVEDGKRELSMGYTADLSFEDGETPEGDHYDAIQRTIRANHLAVVSAARGGSSLRLGDDSHQGWSVMTHFATHPHRVRRGVGRVLFDRCMADAAAAGVQRFECYSSLVAEPFYAALGFVVVEPLALEMGGGITFPSVRMICPFAERIALRSTSPGAAAGILVGARRSRCR